MRQEPWSRRKMRYCFIFNILGDKMESTQKALFWHNEARRVLVWVASWMSYLRRTPSLLERTADKLWLFRQRQLALAFSETMQTILSFQRKTTDIVCCQWWNSNFQTIKILENFYEPTWTWQLLNAENFSDEDISVGDIYKCDFFLKWLYNEMWQHLGDL